jgi:hypothetical protein
MIPAHIIIPTFWTRIPILTLIAEHVSFALAFMQLNVGATKKSAARFMTTGWTTLILRHSAPSFELIFSYGSLLSWSITFLSGL